MVTTKLSKEQMSAIDHYDDDIVSLTTFTEMVRQNPGMYIGSLGIRGFINMIREIFQNGLDQQLDPTSPANWTSISIDEKTLITVVEDNGKGIPFDSMIRIFTSQHTSKNYIKKPFQYSSGLHGVGAKVTNALCDWFIIESYNYTGKAMRLEMKDGYPVGKPVPIPNKDKKQGTKIMFHPELKILGKSSPLNLDYSSVYKLVKLISSQTPIGSIVEFTAIVRENNKVIHEVIENKDGILTDLFMKTKNPLISPVVYSVDDGYHRCAFAFTYETNSDDSADITAFCNMCPSTGTHIDGFLNGLSKWFMNYINNIYLSANSKIKIKKEDVRVGLNAMLSTNLLDPIFNAQSKDEITNAEFAPFCADVVCKGLDEWAKSCPSDLNKLCGYIKKNAEIRTKSEGERVKIAKSYTSNILTGLPEKYIEPTGTEDTEFWIIEGESAKGTTVDARNNARQGILPLKGKIPNAFAKTKAEILNNVECRGILDVIGGNSNGNYGPKHFNIEKVLWKKIVGCPDADPDGSHINALILRLLIMYCPQVLEAGLYYKAVSPLYIINSGKKSKYFVDRTDMLKYYQNIFSKTNDITCLNGEKLTGNRLSMTLLDFADYAWDLECLARTYRIDPLFLEYVLENHVAGVPASKIVASLKKEDKEKYAYISNSKVNGIEKIHGLIGVSYNTVYLSDVFLSDAKKVVSYMHDKSRMIYYDNGKKMSIYEIMSAFQKLQEGTMTRVKGLGEMNADQFKESVMDPLGGNRTLIQYTLDSAKEEIEIIRGYESNKRKLLSYVGNLKRSDVMD